MVVNNLARKHINKVLLRSETMGSNPSCRYYPCSFAGQDCTFCFCPFYPCMLGYGKYVTSGTGRKIWDCSGCRIIHEPEVASQVFQELKVLQKPIEEAARAELVWVMRVIKNAGEFDPADANGLSDFPAAPIQNRLHKL